MTVTQLGEMLRTAREEQGLTLDEAEKQVRIRAYLLEALEAGNYHVFPSPVVTRGLIRNYAKFLKIDPIKALTKFDGNGVVPVKGQRLTPNGIEFMNLSMAPRPFITWDLSIGGLLFLVVVFGAGYFVYLTLSQQPLAAFQPALPPEEGDVLENSALPLPTTTAQPSVTPTSVPPTPTATPLVYSGVTVELVIQQPSWVQILADDTKVFEGILQTGESRSWSAERRVAIRAGNAGGVQVIINGEDRGVMGDEGRVADQVWEKVDDPSLLTPQPAEPGAALPTETVTPVTGEEVIPASSEAQTENQ
jgi:cytoskeletal protein RodZ